MTQIRRQKAMIANPRLCKLASGQGLASSGSLGWQKTLQVPHNFVEGKGHQNAGSAHLSCVDFLTETSGNSGTLVFHPKGTSAQRNQL